MQLSAPRTRRVASIVASTVAAVATAAGLAAVPVLHADAATNDGTGQAATSLSIRAVRNAIRPGGTDTVTGALVVKGAGTSAGRTVTLLARPMGAGAFTPVGTATARDHGGLGLRVMPGVTTAYRWSYAGESDARPSHSGVVRIRVRTPQHHAHRINTSLSVRAVHHRVRLNGADVVRGRLRAGRVPLPHRRVVLVSRTADTHGWTFEGVHRTRRLGVVAFRVEPAADTAYRLVFLGTPLLQPARSGIVRVVTRPDMTLTADPRRIDPGESTTLSGTATDGAAPVAGATVKLLARRAGAHHVHLVATGTTAADGTVSFTDTPARTTSYRLRLVHADGTPGALSDAARVVVRMHSSLSIRGRATETDFVVSGVLRGGGHLLRGRKVTLQAQAAGSADWTDAGARRTNRHGVVRFHEPQAPGTGYRLAYAGGPRFAPSTSGTVVS
jgi:hypothetical protein